MLSSVSVYKVYFPPFYSVDALHISECYAMKSVFIEKITSSLLSSCLFMVVRLQACKPAKMEMDLV